MLEDSSTKSKSGLSVKNVTMLVEHPLLRRPDSESSRVFLRKYDGYCSELKARASQLSVESSISLEPTGPVALIYCTDAEHLESAIMCTLVDGGDDIQSLTDDILRSFLEKEATESAAIVAESELAKLVESLLKMDMTTKSSKCRM